MTAASMPRDAAPAARWRDQLPLLAALAFVLAAATFINVNKSIWADEAFTMDRTRTSLAETLRLAREVSNKPPLYFTLVYWWRTISPSLEWARGLSTACMLLAVCVLHRLGRELRIGRGLLSLGVLAAITPHFIWAAAEARVYAMVVLALSATALMFVRVWVNGSDRPARDTALFVAAAYASLMVFHYAGFILAALFLAGLVYPDRKRLVVAGAVLAALMLPWAAVISDQVGAQRGSYLPPVPVHGPLDLVRWVAFEVTEILQRTVPVYASPARQAAFAGLLGGIVALRLGTARGRLSREEWWALAFGALSFLLVAAVRFLNKTMVDTRHWIVVGPPLLLAVALLASRLRPARLADLALAALGLALALGAASFLRNERGPSDWRGAIRWVMATERAGEPIICFDTNALPIAFYYTGPNGMARIPEDQSTRKDGGRRIELTDTELNRLRGMLALAAGPGRTFWIIEGAKQVRGPETIAAHLGQEVRVLERREYHRVRAYHVQLTAPVQVPVIGAAP